jgi:hypothetical protein
MFRLTTPAGTHSWPRMKPDEKALVRLLQRRYGRGGGPAF